MRCISICTKSITENTIASVSEIENAMTKPRRTPHRSASDIGRREV